MGVLSLISMALGTVAWSRAESSLLHFLEKVGKENWHPVLTGEALSKSRVGGAFVRGAGIAFLAVGVIEALSWLARRRGRTLQPARVRAAFYAISISFYGLHNAMLAIVRSRWLGAVVAHAGSGGPEYVVGGVSRVAIATGAVSSLLLFVLLLVIAESAWWTFGRDRMSTGLSP